MPNFRGKLILCEIHHKGRVYYDQRLADGTDAEIIQKMDDEYFDSGWRPVTKDPMKKGKAVVIILDEGGQKARIYNRQTLRYYKKSGDLHEPLIIDNPAWISGHFTGNEFVAGIGKTGAGQPIALIRTAIDTGDNTGAAGLEYRLIFPEDIDVYEFADTQSFRDKIIDALEKKADEVEKGFHCECLSTGNIFDPDGNLYFGGLHLWMREMNVGEAV